MTLQNKAGSASTATPRPAAELAGQILGDITWVSPTMGYCDCPGKQSHTNSNHARDCVVYVDQIPTIHCFHSSCQDAVVKANGQLRSLIREGATAGKPVKKLSWKEKDRLARRKWLEELRQKTLRLRPQLMREFHWPLADMKAKSPVILEGREPDHWRLLVEKFQPGDIIWIGDIYDSGNPEHARHFSTATDWLTAKKAPGPFICPSTFKCNSTARSNANVLERRFLVVESDVLGKDEVGAVFRWLSEDVGLELVAVVDTAGKSLHGWFRFAEKYYEELTFVLPALGCDPKLFTPSQPVRLPGALRDGKYQSLVYLSGEVAR